MSHLCRFSGWRLLANVALGRPALRVGTGTSGMRVGAGTRGTRALSDVTDDKSDEISLEHDEHEYTEVLLPPYVSRVGEPEHLKRARLVYQSRKRGMLENGILLSTFASQFLSSLSTEQLDMYDRLINEPSNDWDIYNWIVRKKAVPEQYQTEVMKMLQEHVQNKDMEERFVQPPLH